MNHEQFVHAIISLLYQHIHHKAPDNFYYEIYNYGIDRSNNFNVGWHVKFMEFFIKNNKELYSTYLLLKDDGSRSSFVNLILYKMLSMTGYALYLYYESQQKKLLADYFLQKSVITVLKIFQIITFEDAVSLLNEMKTDLDRRARLLKIDNYSYDNMIKTFSLENLGAIADQILIKQNA